MTYHFYRIQHQDEIMDREIAQKSEEVLIADFFIICKKISDLRIVI